jgi:HAE1 family hydrophobic/amphiphilic exporter-1
MATLLALAVCVFGYFAYQALPVSDMPNVYFPSICVECDYPGASPLTMASAVASPLERQFQSLEGLERLYSKSKPGYTVLELTFNLDRNLDNAAADVQAAINRAMTDLPSDLPSIPTWSKINPADAPILYLVVSSETLTPSQLYSLGGNRVVKSLMRIEGVANVTLFGSRPAVRIQVDPKKLAYRGLELADAASTIRSGNVTLPAGNLDGPLQSVSLQAQGGLRKASEFKNLIITYQNGVPVYLKDVADVLDSVEEIDMNCRLWRRGKGVDDKIIGLGVQREPHANTVEVARRVLQALPEIQKTLPGSIEMFVANNLSEPVLAAIGDVKNTLYLAFILVILVIFIFLGRVRDTIIPAVALPISFMLTFVMMYLFDYNLDMLSMMALTLAVGFLVDDAVVVLENIARHLEMGKNPVRAALDGSREITGTVLSMTLSLSAVFIPICFMPGIIGRMFREFAVVIMAAIICSGLVAITLSPSMAGRFLQRNDKGPGPLERASGAIVGFLRKGYLSALRFTLRFNFIAIIIWVACLAGTGYFLKHLPQAFIPKGDSGAIEGDMSALHGTSNTQMRVFQQQVEDVLKSDPAVKMVWTITGMGSSQGSNSGFVFLTLVSRDKREPIALVTQRLTHKLTQLPGVNTTISPVPVLQLGGGGGGGGGGAQYSFMLRSDDTDELYKVSRVFFDKAKKLPGFVDVQTSLDLDSPQLDIKIRRDRARSLGINASDIEETLLLAFAGYKLSTVLAPTDEYKVIMEVAPNHRKNANALNHLYLRSSGSGEFKYEVGTRLVPLSEVSYWEESVGPHEVKHYNQQSEVQISFNLDADTPLGDATRRMEDLAAVTVPASITAELTGEAQEFKKTMKALFRLIIVALVVMYLILGVLYESYVHPITVLSALPVAGFGGLLSLWVCGSVLSIYSFIGIFMLMGIVKKNGIMMVDFATKAINEQGLSPKEAILKACEERFRPIVMTGTAAIAGIMPVALGFGADGASRQPLGITVMGGLIFSQLITLILTPSFYLYMEWIQEKILYRFAFFRPQDVGKRFPQQRPNHTKSNLSTSER